MLTDEEIDKIMEDWEYHLLHPRKERLVVAVMEMPGGGLATVTRKLPDPPKKKTKK